MSSLQILIAWPHHVSTIFSIQCLFGQVSNFSWSELVSVLLTDVNLALAVHFFPRICCLYFIFWHMYFYSCPYGYMDVALIPLFCFMMVSSKAVHCVCLRDKSDACNFGISMPCCIPYWPLRPQIVLEASSMWRTRERVSNFNCSAHGMDLGRAYWLDLLAVYNQLAWNEWSANLPSEWTMFLPLNRRLHPLHDRVAES